MHSLIEHLIDILSKHGSIRARKMFGGYGIYCDGLIFALIINDILYFKADSTAAEYFKSAGSSPFSYINKNGTKVEMSYWMALAEVLEDEEQLSIWFQKSMLAARNKPSTKIKA